MPVKTIRFYHEAELLLPASVDPETGYRYYDQGTVEKARVILRLRQMELSISDIKTHGYDTRLPTREVYIKGPGMIFKGNPKKYLTEIQIPIGVGFAHRINADRFARALGGRSPPY